MVKTAVGGRDECTVSPVTAVTLGYHLLDKQYLEIMASVTQFRH